MIDLSPRAALLIIDLQRAIDHPSWGVRNNPDAEQRGLDLLAAWRSSGRAVFHVRHDSTQPASTYRPGQPGHAFKPGFEPRPGEAVIAKSVNSAFIGTDLTQRLHAAGHLQLVVFGVITNNSVEANRTVALPQSVQEDLNEWRALTPHNQAQDWIFTSDNGKTPLWANNAWYDKIRPTLEPLGLSWVNYQVLRRTSVTLLNTLGADGTIVAAQLGHTVDTSTNVYNKVGIQRQHDAVTKLDQALATRTQLPAA